MKYSLVLEEDSLEVGPLMKLLAASEGSES